jgi:multidrug resistance efflux pump
MKVRFESPKERSPESESGVRIPYAPGKRVFPRLRWYLVLLLVSSPLIFFLVKVGLGWFLVDSPGLVSMDRISLNAPRPGIVREVRVRAGDLIPAGALLVRLEDPSGEGRRAVLEAERQVLARAAPAAPPRSSAPTGSLREALRLAGEAAAYHRDYREKIRGLFAAGAATQAELNLAVAQDQQARAALAGARAALDEALRPVPVPTEGPELKARIAQIDAELATIRAGSGLEILSPREARVLDLLVAPGEAVAQGAPLLLLGDPSRIAVVAFLDPADLRFAAPGRRARIRFPGGSLVAAETDVSSEMAVNTPQALMSPLAENRQSVPVRLRFPGGIPKEYRIDGLPVTVHWGFHLWP